MPPRKPIETTGRRAVEKEMSDLGGQRKVRFGLALKFVVPVTLAVALLIAIMGFMVYGSASESMENEINKAGIFAAKLAASPELDSWDSGYGTTPDIYKRVGRIEAIIEASGGTGSGIKDPLVGASDDVRKRINDFDTGQRAYNKRRLKSLLGSQGALDVIITKRHKDGTERPYSWASNLKRSELAFREGRRFTVPSSPNTEIQGGEYAVKGGGLVPCRIFKHPITNRRGKRVGQAWVVFSVEGLRAGLNDLQGTITLFCVLAIVGCAVVAFVSSRIITRPLGTLLKDIRTVASGDLEHKTRKHSDDEIGILAETFDHMTQNLASAEMMRVDLADKEHQVQIAQEVQDRLFRRELPHAGELRLDAANRLAGDLSSDLVDALVLENGQLGCLVMTASGRGIPAAIILSMARAIFRSIAPGYSSPTAALKSLNRILSPDLRKGLYVSAMYAILDPDSGSMRLASAGHRVPALLFIAAQGGARKVSAEGIALGLDKGPVFEKALTETTMQMEPGDRLLLATEGGFLLQGADGAPLGDAGFYKTALRVLKAGGDAQALLGAISQALGPEPGGHDLALVLATRGQPGVPGSRYDPA